MVLAGPRADHIVDGSTLAPELLDQAASNPTRRVAPASAMSRELPAVLAVLSSAVAVLHFASAPGHFEESWAHGLFFVAVGWLQLAWALAMLIRPSRPLLLVALLNLGVVALWVVSRTVGVPVGPHAGTAEAVGFPDVFATVLEVLIAGISLAALYRPTFSRHRRHVPALVIGLSALLAVGTSAALTPGFAGGPHQGHAEGVATGDAHVHAGAAAEPALTGNTPCEKAGPASSEAQVTAAGGHLHRGPEQQVPLDRATREQFAQQQVLAREVAVRYPTVADAEGAGYGKSTPYIPCIGAHYTNANLVGEFDPGAPSELLYDGTSPVSRIVGLSFLVSHVGEPEGFAGDNDHWHQHSANGGLCLNSESVVIGQEQMPAEVCRARGGHKVPVDNIWMLHDWIVPGFECSWGVLAAECPELGGRAGGTAWDPPLPPPASGSSSLVSDGSVASEG